MLKVLSVSVMILAAGFLASMLYGTLNWKASTRALRARLEAGRIAIQPRVVDFRDLNGLPGPVQHYFRTVLREGEPMVAGARVQHSGTFNVGEGDDRWKPFTSNQHVITRRPGFDWDGRVAMAPGAPVRVHDAYVAGEGILQAKLLGLFPLVNLHDTGAVAEGELMRFLAEAAWYPTALLPSQGVHWEAYSERSAYGTLTDGTTVIRMLFTFDEQGLIKTVLAGSPRTYCGREGDPDPVAGSLLELRDTWGDEGTARRRGCMAAS